MQKHYKPLFTLALVASVFYFFIQKPPTETSLALNTFGSKKLTVLKSKDNSMHMRQLFAQERLLHEFDMQKTPLTGLIPKEEKQRELITALAMKEDNRLRRNSSGTYIFRGPSNTGGRTRAFAVDLLDSTGDTMLSGGVSSGLFRTTNGGESWTKVSHNDEIHNVTALTQDPRPGFQNNWYYATGEWRGNSASIGAAYRGKGVWRSTDNGLTWAQIAVTDSTFEVFDSYFDYNNALEINPVSGHLFIATTGKIYSYDGVSLNIELELPNGARGWTDVVIGVDGRVYASLEGFGVWTSPTGNGDWTQISKNALFDNSGTVIANAIPVDWASAGRIVLAEAPSNTNIIYALYVNGNLDVIEADLWQYDLSNDTWTNYSAKLPDEPGADLPGNDPLAVQQGYDLVVSVKPDNENFVIIGGTNTYKIANITNDFTFVRIGGYANNTSYAIYGADDEEHHPDAHVLEFDPHNNNILFSGTDGGVHKTVDITADTISWQSLNNNYVTCQYYHVALDPLMGSNIVLGGAQDNGTTLGGTDVGIEDNTTMTKILNGDGVAVGVGRSIAANGLQLYAGTQGGEIYGFNNGWSTVTPDNSGSQFVTYFHLDPDNNDYLYYAGNDTLYKTNNATAITKSTWQNTGTLTTKEDLRTFATTRGIYDAESSYMLIGGESGGIFRFDDPVNAASLSVAVNITPTEATVSPGAVVSGLAIHPTNKDIVLAVYANYGINSIFLTTNATADEPDWTLVEQNLAAYSIRSVAIATVDDEIIYFVGTARGLYSNSDPINNDWDIEGADNIGLALISSLAYRPSDNKLLIGTHGNGMFETTVEGSLATKEYSLSNHVFLYPNPVREELNFRSHAMNLDAEMNYEIYDFTGKTISQGILSNKKIDVRTLNSGVYFINLSFANTNQTLQFIKK